MCWENDYRDEVSGRCLDLCGENNTRRCLIDEECHHSSGTCRNKCYGLCDRNFQYCDPQTTHCEACEHVCDPFSIKEYPNCKIHCPEQFKLLNGGLTPGVKSTTTGPSSTPLLSALPSLATATLASANGKSDQYIIISVICVIVIALIVLLVIYVWCRWSNNRGGKRNTREVSRHREDEEQMLGKTKPALPSTSKQTTTNYPQSGSCDTTSTSHIQETEKNQLFQDNVLESSNHRLNNEGLITDYRSYDSDPMCHETIPEQVSGALNRRQSVHTVSEQESLSIDNGCNPLYKSCRSLASFPSYKSVNSFSLGPDESLSFSGFVATQTVESPTDTHVDAKTFYDEQIRQIKSFDWGSVGNLDLREDGQLPPDETVVFQMPVIQEVDDGSITLHKSHRTLASFSSYKSLNSFSLSPYETISLSGFAATQRVESPEDTHIDAKTYYAEIIRRIKSYDWGSVGTFDHGKDGQPPPGETTGVALQMPDLNLPTTSPTFQSRIDEKIDIMEILDKMEFVEFLLLSRDKVTVVIKNNSISLVEARKQLLDAGVPDRMLTVEYLI